MFNVLDTAANTAQTETSKPDGSVCAAHVIRSLVADEFEGLK
jgi:hypothetical protein